MEASILSRKSPSTRLARPARVITNAAEITELDGLELSNNLLLNSYFAVDPLWQQIKLLPDDIKSRLRIEFEDQLKRYQGLAQSRPVGLTNFRNKEYVLENLIKEIEAAINCLHLGGQDPDLLQESVLKFKQLDTHRGVRVVDAFPQLKEFFETNGY